jgi:para-nitrobenzyl esterase
MNGTNHDEGRFFISLATPDGKALPLYKYWAATGLLVGARKSRTVLQQYPYRASGTPALALTTVLTDFMFSCPALNVSSDIAKYVPVYAFEFNNPAGRHHPEDTTRHGQHGSLPLERIGVYLPDAPCWSGSGPRAI